MQLRKWDSSHHELTTELPVELRKNVDIAKVMHEDYKIKTLGISWKPNRQILLQYRFCRAKQADKAGAPLYNGETLRSDWLVWTHCN